MNDYNEFKNLFETYDPPKGGVQGLREKLDGLEIKEHFLSIPKIAVMVTLVVAVLVTIMLTSYMTKPESNLFIELIKNSENPVFIKYGYIKRSGEEISFPDNNRSQFAAMRIDTPNKNVRFYLIDNIN